MFILMEKKPKRLNIEELDTIDYNVSQLVRAEITLDDIHYLQEMGLPTFFLTIATTARVL